MRARGAWPPRGAEFARAREVLTGEIERSRIQTKPPDGQNTGDKVITVTVTGAGCSVEQLLIFSPLPLPHGHHLAQETTPQTIDMSADRVGGGLGVVRSPPRTICLAGPQRDVVERGSWDVQCHGQRLWTGARTVNRDVETSARSGPYRR